MPGSKTCCPVGKVYDLTSGLCTDLNHLNGTDPIDCPCCRVGTTYDSTLGLCVALDGTTTNTIPCPCCPDGYTYQNVAFPPTYPNGYCLGRIASDIVPTVPCLGCNCVTPDDPTCPECGTDGLPITFAYDPMIKNCTDCDPQDINNPTGKIQGFLPDQFLDPLTSNFRLRNKNFI